MPQMMPMLWTLILLFSFLIMFMTCSFLYFIYKPTISNFNSSSSTNMPMWNWKW